MGVPAACSSRPSLRREATEYREGSADPDPGDCVGYLVEDQQTRGRLAILPGVAAIDAPILRRLHGCDAVLIDGTFWSEHELSESGAGDTPASQMGHLPVGGREAAWDWWPNSPHGERSTCISIIQTRYSSRTLRNEKRSRPRRSRSDGMAWGSSSEAFTMPGARAGDRPRNLHVPCIDHRIPPAHHPCPGGPEMQPIHVLTNRYDNSRIGVNLAETKLTVDKVNVSQFGKLFTRPVDGDLYAQPLIVSGMTIDGATCNVVFLATSRNTVYAYEADDPEACLPLWTRNLGPPVPRDDVLKKLGQTYPLPELRQRDRHHQHARDQLADGGGILYVVAKTRRIKGLGGATSKTYAHTIHALDLATGEDAPIPNNPMEIRATVRRSDGSTITFDPLFQLNRPGLLLLDGVLYIAFGSHGDFGEFYGWIMAYDAATLVQRAVYCTSARLDRGRGLAIRLRPRRGRQRLRLRRRGEWREAQRSPRSNPRHHVGDGHPGPRLRQQHPEAQADRDAGRGRDAGGRRRVHVADVMDLNQNDNDLMGGPVSSRHPAPTGPLKRLVLGEARTGGSISWTATGWGNGRR